VAPSIRTIGDSFHVRFQPLDTEVPHFKNEPLRFRPRGLLERYFSPKSCFDREALSGPDVVGNEFLALSVRLSADLTRDVPVGAFIEFRRPVIDIEGVDATFSYGERSKALSFART
jgi:hypothetical protein